MAEQPDFLETLQAGRDAMRRLQESFARYAMPPEQRQALAEGMSQLMFPTDGVRAMSDFIDAFGPPLAQIDGLRAELAEQREQLSEIDERLAHLELTAERLAAAGEQLVAFQEPFMRFAGLMSGQDLTGRTKSSADDDADDDVDEATTSSAPKKSTAKSTTKKSTAKSTTKKPTGKKGR